MDSTTQARSTAWQPPRSIIFPICVITVALSAISQAASVVRRDLMASSGAISGRQLPEPEARVVGDQEPLQDLND
jgi:hypothetical protein